MICRIACALLVCFFVPGIARSSESHYRSYPIGDRALGLGGAYTALADDSSAAYYNPAGLGEIRASSFTLSAALYGLSRESWSSDLGPISASSSDSAFVTYPTAGAWLFGLRDGDDNGVGRLRLALSVVTPDSDVRHSALVAEDLLLLAVNVEDSTLWAGASLGWKVHRKLSLGATLYTLVRNGLYMVQVDSPQLNEGKPGSFRLDQSFGHYSMLLLLGVLARPSERFSVGLTFRTPSLRLAGTTDGTLITPVTGVMEAEEDITIKVPWQLALGLAFAQRGRYALSLDLAYHGSVGSYALVEDLAMEKQAVWNVALGGEYYLTRSWPLRLGFFTNRSAFGENQLQGDNGFGVSLFGDDINMYGATAAMGWEVKNAALSLGASYSVGSAESTLGDVPLRRHREYLFVAIGTSFFF